MTKTNHPKQAETEFEALRSILLGPEKQRVEALQQRFDDPQQHAQAISQVLPAAVKMSTEQENNQLSTQLMPVVEEVVKVSVRKDIQVFADALFPVIGPAIRKSISETFRQMVQSINQALEHSFSWKGIKWRLEAWRTGKTFAEIVLHHSLVYRVEQVFLIHKETGILLQHVALAEVEHQDADLVSAMLTAIQDFVKDSFHVNTEQNLNQVRLGDFSLWIEQGPEAVIAGVIRGDAPENTRKTLIQTLESIHQQYPAQLKEFSGEVGAFHATEESLQRCLLSQYQNKQKKISWMTWLLLGSVAVVLIVWMLISLQTQQRWDAYLQQLKNEPGFIITDSAKEQGRYIVRGLRDPLAKTPRQLQNNSSFAQYSVEHRLQPYQSLQKEFVLKRTKQLLNPPTSVNFSFNDGILTVAGQADTAWITDFQKQVVMMAGISSIDSTGLTQKVDLSRFEAPDSVQLRLENNKLVAMGSAPYIWNQRVKNILKEFPEIKSYDNSQLELELDLSLLQAPTGVRVEFKQGELILSGTAPNEWIESLSEKMTQLPAIQEVNLEHLANADLDDLMHMKQDLEAEAIFFDTGLTVNKPGDDSLNRIYQKLQLLIQKAERLSQSVHLLVQGSSDSTGVYQRRLAVSLQRAEYVRQFLIAQGINPMLLEIQSLVEQFEPHIETTEQQKRFNRRVSFEIHLGTHNFFNQEHRNQSADER